MQIIFILESESDDTCEQIVTEGHFHHKTSLVFYTANTKQFLFRVFI